MRGRLSALNLGRLQSDQNRWLDGRYVPLVGSSDAAVRLFRADGTGCRGSDLNGRWAVVASQDHERDRAGVHGGLRATAAPAASAQPEEHSADPGGDGAGSTSQHSGLGPLPQAPRGARHAQLPLRLPQLAAGIRPAGRVRRRRAAAGCWRAETCSRRSTLCRAMPGGSNSPSIREAAASTGSSERRCSRLPPSLSASTSGRRRRSYTEVAPQPADRRGPASAARLGDASKGRFGCCFSRGLSTEPQVEKTAEGAPVAVQCCLLNMALCLLERWRLEPRSPANADEVEVCCRAALDLLSKTSKASTPALLAKAHSRIAGCVVWGWRERAES